MGKQPVVTARDIHRLLNHFGNYALKRNCGASRKHQKFVKINGRGSPVVIPIHPKEKMIRYPSGDIDKKKKVMIE